MWWLMEERKDRQEERKETRRKPLIWQWKTFALPLDAPSTPVEEVFRNLIVLATILFLPRLLILVPSGFSGSGCPGKQSRPVDPPGSGISIYHLYCTECNQLHSSYDLVGHCCMLEAFRTYSLQSCRGVHLDLGSPIPE